MTMRFFSLGKFVGLRKLHVSDIEEGYVILKSEWNMI